MSEIIEGKFVRNETNANALSGSEMMAEALIENLGEDRLKEFQIVVSRERSELREDKIRLFWAHDLPEDPESEKALDDGKWQRYHRIIFVSNWQCQMFMLRYGIPWSRTQIMKNAINPISFDMDEKIYALEMDKEKTIKFIYHTTPHRGLHLLVPIFEKLQETHPNIHLDVYSSFKLYGWEERDKSFEPLYDRIRENDHMGYHGAVSNEEVRAAILEADVYVYPSVWTETSCISLIEAMSGGLMCIHPDSGALFETASNWTFMYHMSEDQSQNANQAYALTNNLLDLFKEGNESIEMRRRGMKNFADVNYNWEVRKREWINFLEHAINLPREFEAQPVDTFSYKVH